MQDLNGDDSAMRVLRSLSKRERDRGSATMRSISKTSGVSTRECVRVAKLLDDFGLVGFTSKKRLEESSISKINIPFYDLLKTVQGAGALDSESRSFEGEKELPSTPRSEELVTITYHTDRVKLSIPSDLKKDEASLIVRFIERNSH